MKLFQEQRSFSNSSLMHLVETSLMVRNEVITVLILELHFPYSTQPTSNTPFLRVLKTFNRWECTINSLLPTDPLLYPSNLGPRLIFLPIDQLAQMDKNLPAMRETQVWFLGQEDPLEKGMASHSSIPVWRIPWTEEPGGLQSMGSQRVRHNWVANIFTFIPVTLLGWDFFEKYHAAIFFSQKEEILIILKLYSAHFTWQYWKPFSALNSFEPEIN